MVRPEDEPYRDDDYRFRIMGTDACLAPLDLPPPILISASGTTNCALRAGITRVLGRLWTAVRTESAKTEIQDPVGFVLRTNHADHSTAFNLEHGRMGHPTLPDWLSPNADGQLHQTC